MNWRKRENDGVYLFFLTLRRLKIWHDSSKNILPLTRHGWRFYISHIFFFIFLKCFKRVGSVLSSPELHVDSIFYVLLCTYRVRTLKRAKPL